MTDRPVKISPPAPRSVGNHIAAAVRRVAQRPLPSRASSHHTAPREENRGPSHRGPGGRLPPRSGCRPRARSAFERLDPFRARPPRFAVKSCASCVARSRGCLHRASPLPMMPDTCSANTRFTVTPSGPAWFEGMGPGSRLPGALAAPCGTSGTGRDVSRRRLQLARLSTSTRWNRSIPDRRSDLATPRACRRDGPGSCFPITPMAHLPCRLVRRRADRNRPELGWRARLGHACRSFPWMRLLPRRRGPSPFDLSVAPCRAPSLEGWWGRRAFLLGPRCRRVCSIPSGTRHCGYGHPMSLSASTPFGACSTSQDHRPRTRTTHPLPEPRAPSAIGSQAHLLRGGSRTATGTKALPPAPSFRHAFTRCVFAR